MCLSSVYIIYTVYIIKNSKEALRINIKGVLLIILYVDNARTGYLIKILVFILNLLGNCMYHNVIYVFAFNYQHILQLHH